MHRILLLMPATSYRARDFLDAARRLGMEVMVASNHRAVLQEFTHGSTMTLSFEAIGSAVDQIVERHQGYPISTVIGTDEETTVLAAAASKALGLPHNSIESVTTAHDKYRFRCVLDKAGLRSPRFKLVSLRHNMAAAASSVGYPCVLKPLRLCASRGVIRADNETEFVAAGRRIAAILQETGIRGNPSQTGQLLAESFIPGCEVALEGLLQNGALKVLALFDKPDPLDGPFFEETIFVTPSRLPGNLQILLISETQAAARALGLREGPVHAELRINEQGPWLIEIAARSIGGLCSRTLSFARGLRLEDLILCNAVGLPAPETGLESRASGVMMIPIPRAGQLSAVEGLAAARSVPCVQNVIISIPVGEDLVPLPEGGRYLGFIFARAQTPGKVESALRCAHQKLHFVIDDANFASPKPSPRLPLADAPIESLNSILRIR